MPTQLLIAPAAAGKTEYCLTRIQTLRRDAPRPLAAIWVIAPNGANARAFARRLAAAGGAIGVHLGTFYALYEELLAQAGQLVARLDEPILHRLLRDVAAELRADGALDFFAGICATPGFSRALHAAIQELKRARITPEQFADTVRGLEHAGARLEELARLYAAYQERLLPSDWADGEGQGWLAALALENDARLARGWQLLVVDGFDEFNPTQLEVLRLLAARVDETLVTLTGDPSTDAPRLAHRRFLRARAALASALPSCLPLSLPPRSPATPLARLSAALFAPSPRPQSGDGAIEFIEARNRAEQVRAALRWLKARVVRDGIALGETALLARDIEPYRAFVDEVAAEFGMPIHFGEGAMLAANPAVAALLNFLAVPLQDFQRRRVVDAWRSPYADWSAQRIETGDAERLDAAARWGQVVAGREQWADTLARLTRASPRADDADDDAAPLVAPTGAAASALSKKFQAFAARLTPPARATLRDYVAWTEELIGDDPDPSNRYAHESVTSLRIAARARAAMETRERDVAALREFKNVLRALVFAETVLNRAREIAFADFWTELRGAVEAASYRVPPPEGIETILVASALSARGLSFRAVALIGLSEGEFPRATLEDPLLPDADRAALGLTPRLTGDEVTFFYEAVTRAREKILLTRSYLADDGQPWEPSPYWEHVLELVDAKPARSDVLSPENAASLPELLAASPLSSSPHQGGEKELETRGAAVRHGAAVLATRTAAPARGPFEGDLAALRARLTRDYAPARPWSASRLETFGNCPFAFFAAYALDLEPRPPTAAGYDVQQLGTMYHAVLETLYRGAPDPTDLDALLGALPAAARRVFDAAPETYGFRPTALWRQQRAELERILADTLRALAEASDGWRPREFELAFDSLVLRGDPGGEIRLRGYIDRVDVNTEGKLRVIDYKAGASSISKNDLDDGKRLQLALYALALRDALGKGEPVAGMYWHIGAAKASSLKLEKYPGGIDAALAQATAHALSHASRVAQGDFAPRPPDGGCPAWCPAAAFCWRYQSKK